MLGSPFIIRFWVRARLLVFLKKSVTSKNKVPYTDQLCVSVAVGCGSIVLDDDNGDIIIIIIYRSLMQNIL
jgi:hypothetical protein